MTHLFSLTYLQNSYRIKTLFTITSSTTIVQDTIYLSPEFYINYNNLTFPFSIPLLPSSIFTEQLMQGFSILALLRSFGQLVLCCKGVVLCIIKCLASILDLCPLMPIVMTIYPPPQVVTIKTICRHCTNTPWEAKSVEYHRS